MASRRLLLAPSASRALIRPQPTSLRHSFARARFYASESGQGSNHTTAGIIGGLAGGFLVFGGGYAWYHFSGAKTAINFVHKGHSYLNHTTKQIQDSAPEPNEALKWLRSTAQTYAAFIPGAKGYVDQAFDDLDAVHSKHGKEVDEIVSNTYHKLKDLTKDKGISLDTAGDAMNVLGDAFSKIISLAGDAAEDLMNNHPKLKQQFGGNIDHLKQMGDQYGPEAKKQVDETWDQIRSIVSKGLGASTIPQIKKLVEDKTEAVQKMGNELFDRGMEQAKPYLDKAPQVKQLVEENKEALKQGDMGSLWKKIQDAASSGTTEDLQNFVNETKDKVQQKGQGSSGGLSSLIGNIPGGSEIFSKLGKLQDIGQKHGKEAEDLLKSTMDEIQQVLQKKVSHAEELAKKGSQEAQDS